MRWRHSLFALLAAFTFQSTLQAAPLILSSTTTTAPIPVISTFTWRTVPNHAFAQGEVCSFVIKWGVVTAGKASLSVQDAPAIDGRPAFHLVAAADSSGVVDDFYRVRDRNESWLDQASLVSVRYARNIHEGKYRIEETTLLDQRNHHFKLHAYRADRNSYEDEEGSFPDNVLDVLGSLYYLRAQRLQVGETYILDVISGKKVWPLKVLVKKRETIRVPAGKFDCFLVQPQLRQPGLFVAKGKKLEVWLTADPYHMPVRMQSEVFIGHVAAELVAFGRTPVKQ